MQRIPPTRSESDLLDGDMDTEPEQNISDSITAINLSGILNKTIQSISPQTSSQPPTNPTTGQPPLLDSRGKRFKAALIVIAKASHHKTFMETCLARNQPPRNMSLWVQPHIYHSNQEVEKLWKDTLSEASRNLTLILIKHYASLIKTEQETLETIRREVTQYLTQSDNKQKEIETWKQISKLAEDEARKLAESLKESREGKLHRKRRRTESMQNLLPDTEQKQHTIHPPLIDALNGLITSYSRNEQKNEQKQQEHTYMGRGKQPAHGRGYPKKGGPPPKP